MVENRCRDERPKLAPTDTREIVRCHFHERVKDLPAAIPPRRKKLSNQADAEIILDLDDLAISYAKPGILDQVLGRPPSGPSTVESVDLALRRGEIMALVGESGSGKSTILRAIAGLLGPSHGSIAYGGGENLAASVKARPRELLRYIQLIFQDPDSSLNPRHTVAEILAMPLKLYFGLKGAKLHQTIVTLLEQVRLGAHYLERLPSQLSGGEKQRVAVARAFAAEPELILCDEVTSALDVSVQAALLGLLVDLQADQGTTYLFVSHDLAVVRALADRVAVLYMGRICELGPVDRVYGPPYHPYTKMLLGAVLEPDPDVKPILEVEDVLDLSPPATGCSFQHRCPRHMGDMCNHQTPPWRIVKKGHSIRCHLPLDELHGE
jgi:peptide/nickel transport system ATP-binding protein